jgi:hypothetical protein
MWIIAANRRGDCPCSHQIGHWSIWVIGSEVVPSDTPDILLDVLAMLLI